MYSTVRRAIKMALSDLDKISREEWILQQAGQVAIAVAQITWCRDVTECLKANKILISLQKFKDKSVQNLNRLVAMVRGKLSKINRGKLGALITIEVHARDIILGLINGKVKKVGIVHFRSPGLLILSGKNSCVTTGILTRTAACKKYIRL